MERGFLLDCARVTPVPAARSLFPACIATWQPLSPTSNAHQIFILSHRSANCQVIVCEIHRPLAVQHTEGLAGSKATPGAIPARAAARELKAQYLH